MRACGLEFIAGPSDIIFRSERRTTEAGLHMGAMPRVHDSDDEEEDSLRSYEPIDLLQDAGVKATDIAKLKNDGFATIGQLFQVSQRKLLDVKGISEAKMDKVPGIHFFVDITAFLHLTMCTSFSASSSRQKGNALHSREIVRYARTLTEYQHSSCPRKVGSSRPTRCTSRVRARYLSPPDRSVRDTTCISRALILLKWSMIVAWEADFDQILGGGLETMSVTEVHQCVGRTLVPSSESDMEAACYRFMESSEQEKPSCATR